MPITVEKIIFAIFADVLEVEEGDVTLDFSKEEDSEWDSVNSLRLFTNIEDEFSIRLDMNEFMNTSTVRGIVELVEAARI
ncbi:acyl carrier protein [Halalkalibacter alkalisediminis]|uniref:Acyl carrier protein n=1 Tax=Halalkalibacter alkalisediminis TaxID=935616 RepID=A0ABV6NP22_9BACI|nr:acyl carrier protein [Halalkalibacter alkalisediminis]